MLLVVRVNSDPSSNQTDSVKDQLDTVHGMIGQMHQWFLENLSNVQSSPTSSTDVRLATSSQEIQLQPAEPLLTFAVLESSAEHRSTGLCSRASFHSGWLQVEGCRIFRCVCGSNDDLDFSCKGSSVFD